MEEVGGEVLCFPGMGTYVCKEGGREGGREACHMIKYKMESDKQ